MAAYPHITFKSTSVERRGEHFAIHGDLALHGVTKPVSFDLDFGGHAKAPIPGDERVGLSGRTAISRKDFGLTWNAVLEAGGVAGSDRVEITLDIEGIKAPPEGPPDGEATPPGRGARPGLRADQGSRT